VHLRLLDPFTDQLEDHVHAVHSIVVLLDADPWPPPADLEKCMSDELIPRDYVLARWGYSELNSREQGEHYARRGDLERLRNSQALGVPFDELDQEERTLLLKGWCDVRGGASIFGTALAGVSAFQLTYWTKEDLGSAYIIGHFYQWLPPASRSRAVTFKEWVETEPYGVLSEHHPLREPEGFTFTQDEPVTIARIQVLLGVIEFREFKPLNGFQGFMLLDGYHRAVQVWRTKDPSAKLAVYVPHE
jgi:hypothetical protein